MLLAACLFQHGLDVRTHTVEPHMADLGEIYIGTVGMQHLLNVLNQLLRCCAIVDLALVIENCRYTAQGIKKAESTVG